MRFTKRLFDPIFNREKKRMQRSWASKRSDREGMGHPSYHHFTQNRGWCPIKWNFNIFGKKLRLRRLIGSWMLKELSCELWNSGRIKVKSQRCSVQMQSHIIFKQILVHTLHTKRNPTNMLDTINLLQDQCYLRKYTLTPL